MSKFKQIQQLESNLFDIVEKLNYTFTYKKKDQYKLHLVALDELNEEYCEITGNYYIHPMKTLSYYEKLWEF